MKLGAQVIQERRGIVSKLEIEARMREDKAQAQVIVTMHAFLRILRSDQLVTLAPNLNHTKRNSSAEMIYKRERCDGRYV